MSIYEPEGVRMESYGVGRGWSKSQEANVVQEEAKGLIEED